MRPTRILTLVSVLAIDALAALIFSDFFARQGHSVLIAPASLAFTLPAIAILLFTFAWPMVRYRRDMAAAVKAKASQNVVAPKPVKRVDPFYAVRVLLLAKASSISASAIFGWQLGVLFYLLSRPAQVAESLTRTIASAVGAIILLVVALVVERICRLPGDANDGEAADLTAPKAGTGTGVSA